MLHLYIGELTDKNNLFSSNCACKGNGLMISFEVIIVIHVPIYISLNLNAMHSLGVSRI